VRADVADGPHVHEPIASLAHLIARVRAATIPVPPAVRRDALLAAMRADGTLARLNGKWFAPDFIPAGAPAH
jgi:hypothetical protein